MTLPECDVVIVGAGITGLAHAWTAAQAGLQVVVLERHSEPVGASVRNFGHLCFSVQPAGLRDTAAASRAGWLAAAGQATLPVQQVGTVVVARTPVEDQVLQALVAAAPAVAEPLTASQTADRLGLGASDAISGVFLAQDMRADPRRTAPQLAAWLAEQGNVELHWKTSFLGTASYRGDAEANGKHVVRTSRGDIAADQVIVCVGHDVDYLYPELAAEFQVQRCRLNMVRAELDHPATIEPAVLTATSMARYGAFGEAIDLTELREELQQRVPELVACDANVMFTQAPDGSLLVGDSHHYGDAATPFIAEQPTEAIGAEVSAVLGGQQLRITERWQGIYASSPLQTVLRQPAADGVHVVSVTSGVGMTLAFGIAAETMSALGLT